MDNQDETPFQEVVYKPTTKNSFSKHLKTPKTTNFFPYVAAATASLMAAACGTAVGWTSPVLPKLMTNGTENPLGTAITHNEESWITGFLCLGAMFGPLGAGTLAEKIGRKKTLLLLTVPVAFSFLILAFARSILLYYILRFTLGIGAGSIFTVLPMYLAEIAEDYNRGTLGCFIGIGISSGLLFDFIIGPYVSLKVFTLSCIGPLVLFVIVFSLWVPETPHFLASINNMDGLEWSLLQLRKKPMLETQKEALKILETIREEHKHKGGVLDLFKNKTYRKGLTISIGLILLQQFSGINAVLCYMQPIFGASGGGLPPETCALIVAVVQVLVSILTSYVVEKLGRKILLIFSLLGCCASLLALGIYFSLKCNGLNVDGIFWLPVLSLLVYIITFSVGLGPLPWAVMAELFPANVKSAAACLTSVSFFLGGFIITLSFPIMVANLGMAQCFWIFAVGGAVGALFVYCVLPETKGRNLQEIQKLLES